ncbi:MAG: aminotransferase class III-fold pyridoxal phosphate-dependent enzyme [Nitrososphaeraceae archaeon]|nr:aminotransferase class III-fold pyridoxal phosphate-dependent enzyme [Nitrososphaeraceae archaeon]MDW0137442.1 aminotransferase class III-fold pyridoxal phosphate-dependent enzyme [Nitrososphaeraceae archaeon]
MVNIPGPKATKLVDEFKKMIYDSTFTYPLVIKTGSRCVIEDIDGIEYLDFTSNIGSCPLGYSHPEILEVIKDYSSIEKGVNKIAGQDFYCEEHFTIAKKLLSISKKNSKVFFINSGAEAVENAIKIAYKKMGTLPGVSCYSDFHGRTLGALSFTFSREVQKTNFPELPVKRIKFCTVDSDPQINQLENLLKEYKVAFILTEIIQGEGGLNVASKLFIQNIRKLADEYNVPLIFDEVQSGMGRTGKWWAYEHCGVEPDIMSVAKALQVGATVYDKKYEPTESGVLSSTWGGGSRIDMAIGSKIIEIIMRDNLLSNSQKIGNILLENFVDLVGINGVIDARGIGLMIGLEFDTRTTRDNIVNRLFKKGLLVLPAGIKSIRIMPPLIINEEEATKGISTINDTINEYNK